MRLCYVIMFHKEPDQLFRLVDRLRHRNGCHIIIHICKNVSREVVDGIHRHYKSETDIYFSKREYGNWGEFGLVKGALNSFQLAFDLKLEFDYFTLMSGQHYPIKSNQYIHDFLAQHAGKEFVYFFPLNPEKDSKYYKNHPWGADRQKGRYEYRFIKVGEERYVIPDKRYEEKSLSYLVKSYLYMLKGMMQSGKWDKWKEETIAWALSVIYRKKRTFPEGLAPYGGSDWFTITKEFAAHLLTIDKTEVLYQIMTTSLLPVEIFYQTVLMNSSFKAVAENNNLNYIDWSQKGDHPSVLTMKDFEALKRSDKLYARKFDPEVDRDVMDKIDREILNLDNY